MTRKQARTVVEISLAEFLVIQFSTVMRTVPPEVVEAKLARIRRKVWRRELN